MKFLPMIALGLFVAGCDTAYAQNSYSYDNSVYEITPVAGHAALTDAKGMTLYIFDKDSAGTSVCYNDCADSWPPYVAAAGAKAPIEGLTQIERKDGTMQWAKNGQALYYWVGDAEPGDATGDGIGGVWHVAH